MFIEVLLVFVGLSDKSMRRVFVDLAVLIAGEYLLSAEIWVVAYVCPKRSLRVCCAVVSDEALSMKVLSEVDGVYCLVVQPSSFLSIKTKDHSSLLGESLWVDCKREEFIVSIGAGCKSESISCRFSS